jgi:hypothetical protein
MRHYRCFTALLIVLLALTGCASIPSSKLHYTIKQDPDARPLQHIALLPVDMDVYEMSAGGVKEEVPEWSHTAETNIRHALLVSRDVKGSSYPTRQIDSSSLTPDEQEILEEHLALFNAVAANALWASLPANTAWHFKTEHFDYTLGNGLSFLKTKYGLDAGLIILGEDVVTTAGRKTTAFVGAMLGIAIPLGHSVLIAGLVDFNTGDLLWMNHEVSTGGTDLRDADSCREMADRLMKEYPGLQMAKSNTSKADN